MARLIIIVCLIFASCSSKKVNKNKESIDVKQKIETKDSLNLTNANLSKTIDTTSILEQLFEPIDTTKPMVINQNKGIYQNVRFKTLKTKNGISVSNQSKSVLNQTKSTLNDMSTEIDKNDKIVDKKNTYFIYYFFIILIIIIFIYLIIKRRW